MGRGGGWGGRGSGERYRQTTKLSLKFEDERENAFMNSEPG